ncbi:hypothetical protein [Jiella marina]|uniref:hypothetical protein n=1 Tax=Jiella sp. LLJ827 TaxID=2917712 RepID=UPI0021014823|nr:hypothetical protein [Jiella sp. LLJ827]MCQ0986432.1 hypothetical protein [Jiella sp. LLJ827]
MSAPRPRRAALQAATPPVVFRVHYSDGTSRLVEVADADAARATAKRPGVLITKVKRDRTGVRP